MSPSDPEKLFQRLLRELKPICARGGFAKRSQNFVAESPECWGVINFQKSRYSDSGQKNFTINVAVASKRILDFQNEPTEEPPAYYAAHWQDRIGSLIPADPADIPADPADEDTWWVLSDEESYPFVRSAVADAVEHYAIPSVRSLLTEDALLEKWRGQRPGGFETLRLRYESVLLAERGLYEELGPVLSRILEITSGGRFAQSSIDHVMKLKARYSIPDHLA